MIRLLLANLLLRWREHRDRDRIADLQAQIERARLAAGDQTHEARDRYTRRKRELEAQVRQHGDRLARLARQEEREARERIGRLAPAAPGRSRAPVSQPTPPRVSQEDGGRLFERVGRRRISGEGCVSTNRIARMKAPKGHCRGCGRPVPKGRFTWCSDVCVRAALIQLSPVVARRRVEERDRSICAQCGFDARRAEHVLGYLVERSYQRRSDAATYREALVWLLDVWAPRRTPRRRTDLWGWTVPHLWEADHIRPVVEGGGECELDNYRTLCIPCHRAETRELARRRAQRRKMPLFQEATA